MIVRFLKETSGLLEGMEAQVRNAAHVHDLPMYMSWICTRGSTALRAAAGRALPLGHKGNQQGCRGVKRMFPVPVGPRLPEAAARSFSEAIRPPSDTHTQGGAEDLVQGSPHAWQTQNSREGGSQTVYVPSVWPLSVSA